MAQKTYSPWFQTLVIQQQLFYSLLNIPICQQFYFWSYGHELMFLNMEKYTPPNLKITCNQCSRNFSISGNGNSCCLLNSFICTTWLYLWLNLSEFSAMVICYAMHRLEFLTLFCSHACSSLILLETASQRCTLQFNSSRCVSYSFSSKNV